MARTTHGGTEWLRRHKRSLLGTLGGSAGLIGAVLTVGPDYKEVRDCGFNNATKILELEKRFEEDREARRRQWERISAMQLEIERLKAQKDR